MRKSNILAGLLAALCLLVPQGVWAEQKLDAKDFSAQAAVLTDAYRLLSGSDFAIISQRKAEAYLSDADGTAGEPILFKWLTGQDIYDLLSTKVEQGGEEYPYYSGLQVEIKSLLDSGKRHERVEGVYVNGSPIDFEAKYWVGLSEDYASGYEMYETEASFTPDHAYLRQFIASIFDTVKWGEVEKTDLQTVPEATPEAAKDNGAADGKAIVQNQSTILFGALGLLLVTLLLYLILRRKKKKEAEQEESL